MLTLPWDNPILPGFIVFEGLDGAGTTTQTHRLCGHFNTVVAAGGNGREAIQTCEPTEFLTGKTIRTLLMGPEHVEPWTLALLFAADRHEHLNRPRTGIRHHLQEGRIVVSDRYLFSSLAYQGAYADFVSVEKLNHQFPLPEHLIFIDTPRKVAQERMSRRADRDSLEQEHVQERVEGMYREIISDFEKRSRVTVHRIDGGDSVEAIGDQIGAIFSR